jgi:hypothetical protein
MTEVVSQRPIPVWKRAANSNPEEVRQVLSIFNKVVPSNITGFIRQILDINVLENPDDETPIPQDSSRMKPIIDSILSKFKDNDRNVTVNAYSVITASLMSEWRGRQKHVFKRLMLETTENYLKSYLSSELLEDFVQKEEKQVIPCVNLIKMLFNVSTYNNEQIIPIHIAFKALYMFIGQEINKFEVLYRALFNCYDIIKEQPLFDNFIKKIIVDNLNTLSKSGTLSKKLEVECIDLLECINSGFIRFNRRKENKENIEATQIVL